jgi:hypothetical protein
MTKQYTIKWYIKNKPEEVKGGTLVLDDQTAIAWVNELNHKYPNIKHYKEPIE